MSDVTGYWAGTYFYNGAFGQPVQFDAVLQQHSIFLSGTITEENTFDADAGPMLHAVLSGHVALPSILFQKTYDGRGIANHTVTYEGDLSEDGMEINGTWKTQGISGPFVMKRDKASHEARKVKTVKAPEKVE